MIGVGQLTQDTYQAMPNWGRLAENFNLHFEALFGKACSVPAGYGLPYVVTTVKSRNGRLHQAGSGPNFQGDLMTLCSCKHEMRAYPDIRSLERVWIAGYTASRGLVSNKLFYFDDGFTNFRVSPGIMVF